MGTWSTAATLEAPPERVLSVLTKPESCARWSPVRFELDALGGARLQTGTRARVGGRLVGRRVDFDLEILHADQRGLKLRAHGPMRIEARYEAEPAQDATVLRAVVSVDAGEGVVGRVAARAADALLAAGVLDATMQRIAGEVATAPAG
jgi:uncharacterized protein YndB with AHSA1/START domain